eukprot:gnl/MRDRNA2_/MRDRNA2_31510_c0_seq1.p1 gnl/MRDRNA2_/MRDRNA2_31510_c0~~gnl/MRDRNA2_/MRDRNA2_31510_c0_seq1.p1  ORF type:complete len:326 (-),score=58.40 gnl/MRDRNA2_/MRDRNA2_31510_c0_seq1:199-1176(-)
MGLKCSKRNRQPAVTSVNVGCNGSSGGPSMQLFLGLPDETLHATLCCVGVSELARSSISCQKLHHLILDPFFIKRYSIEKFSRSDISNLEQLAIARVMTDFGCNRVYFELGDDAIDAESAALVEFVAALTKRHPSLLIRVEGHTSRRAPPTLAPGMTQARAISVGRRLTSLGVNRSQIILAGWGKAVAELAGWTPGRETAVAEVFCVLKGLHFPARPSWYEESAGSELLTDLQDDPLNEGRRVSQLAAHTFRGNPALLRQIQILLQQGPQPQQQPQNNSNDVNDGTGTGIRRPNQDGRNSDPDSDAESRASSETPSMSSDFGSTH